MTELLVLWAQALDNVSADHIEFRGRGLSDKESTGRQEAVSLVSAVVKSGTRLYDNEGVRLTEDGRRFVVEVLSAERDSAGRQAPIVCCGTSDSMAGEEIGAVVLGGLEEFSKRIGRSLLPEHIQRTSESFAVLKKKHLRRRLARTVLLGAAAIATVTLVAWLLSSAGW